MKRNNFGQRTIFGLPILSVFLLLCLIFAAWLMVTIIMSGRG
jgi:hypothetical protein